MKFNWKLALMGIAAVMMVACKGKNNPKGPGDDDDEGFVSKISVTDNSIAEWDNLPAEYVFKADCPAGASLLGLKSVKVYADRLYINILMEYNADDITDKSWVPVHVYLNTDNSDKSGGYADQYLDANTDVMLEGSIFAEGEAYPYNPSVAHWWGEVGGTGWEWSDPNGANDESDCWGAIVCAEDMPIGNSQIVNGKVEIQLMRELIPTPANAPWNANEFGIGFDIQQNWNSVGVLPISVPTDDNGNGYAKKLQIKIDPAK